jgi:uncharacterized SAM-binding protein YcdF (DUF218 family)
MQFSKGKMITRTLITIIGILGLLWFMLPFFTHRIINIGNSTGFTVFACLIIYGIWMIHINSFIAKAWNYAAGRIVLSALILVVVLIIILVILLSGCMIKAANQKPSDKATVVVLGCGVYGERASLMLLERLDAAYDYLIDNKDAVCILSGGRGPGEDISEAECMYRYLTKKGIDKERLFLEDKSTSTRENLAFSKEIIEQHGLYPQVAIVTNEFHEYRSGRVAKTLGLEASSIPGHTAWWLFPTYYVRELYGILYEWVF